MQAKKQPGTRSGLGNLVERPLYSFEEADLIAGTRRGRAKRWVRGHSVGANEHELGISFLDLVELLLIATLEVAGYSLSAIRGVREAAQDLLDISHPFAMSDFKAEGQRILLRSDSQGHGSDSGKVERLWEEKILPLLENLDYDAEGLARRWWPAGRLQPIVIDPDYGFGFPVVAGTGVRTETILERYRAGDAETQIASDFNIESEQVTRALQFELNRVA